MSWKARFCVGGFGIYVVYEASRLPYLFEFDPGPGFLPLRLIIGMDLFTAQSRFMFGRAELLNGLDFVVASLDLFSISEILVKMELKVGAAAVKVYK